MKSVMTSSLCLLLFVFSVLIFRAGNSYAVDLNDDVSYFSTPEEVDAAETEVRDVVASEAAQSAIEVAKIENEIKAGKKEVRNVLKEIVQLQKVEKPELLAAATERLAVVRGKLSTVQKNADETLAKLTGVKQATIASMRAQKMGVTEITRELGAMPESIVVSARVDTITLQPIGITPKGSASRSLGPKRSGSQRGVRSRIGGGTVRDLRSGLSVTPGITGGNADKAIGLSRVSGKAKLGSKESRVAKNLSARGGRGRTPTAKEKARALSISTIKSRPDGRAFSSSPASWRGGQSQTKK
ncbi:hypothetical protein [Desulfovibrio sp. JC022]|uniref:hypothetical protein n=1 Tax=Desulfovibrio sp. JC022 TaxID=2593642 RepID=UPI0013D1BEFA|nr:hypothetical protein [Desulfovibrio sp. JC022]NDV24628.1 hypothetical protein [Desulfovibrio sp. JC022]